MNRITSPRKLFLSLIAICAISLISPSGCTTSDQSPAPSRAAQATTKESAPRQSAAKLPEGRKDMLYSLEVPMPHTAWAKPYYRGPIKAWILSPIVPNGDTVSLLNRFDMDYDIVSCDMSWEMNEWGIGDVYGKRSNKESFGRKQELGYATEDLTSDKHYDVMIIPTVIGWNTYPEKMREAIVKRVQEGAGLVLIAPQDAKQEEHNPNGPDEILIPKLSPISGATPTQYHWYGDWERLTNIKGPGAWTIKQPKHSIVSGVCWEEMPLTYFVQVQDFTKVADDATLIAAMGDTPTLAVKQFGKGRVVAINWYADRHNSGLTPGDSPDPAPKGKLPTWDYWEQYYNLLGRSALWAAGRESEMDVLPANMENGSLVVDIDNRVRQMNATLHLIIKDERGRIVAQSDTAARLAMGASQQKIAIKSLPGGTNHLEVIARDGAKSVGWGAVQIQTPKIADVTALTITPDAVKNGQEVRGEVSLNGKADAAVRFELRDPFGRILAVSQQPVSITGEKKVPYSFKVENPVSLVVFVRAMVVKDGQTLSEKDSDDAVVTPDEPKFTDYEVIPWGFSSSRDLWDVKAAQYRKFNATGNNAATPETTRAGFITKGHAEPPPETLGIYWFHPGRERLLKLWADYKKDGDKTKLTRDVCLSDPQTFKQVEEKVSKKVAEQKKYNPGTYYIGDESSLTAYTTECDLDFNPKSLEAFRAWVKDRYGAIEKVNDKWQTTFTDFAQIVPPTIIEVEKDPKLACAWAEHRTFQEIQYENILKLIRQTVKQQDPNGEVELTGTQSATSFNAVDWARHTRHVKRFVPYNINFAYDQLRCFNPGVKMAALTGYGSTGDGVKLSLWNQAFHGLLSANIFWEWSVVDPDMTLSQNAEDIGTVFAELRGKGIGRLLGETTWATSPIAIYYSQPSIHAARTLKTESICHDNRNAWCQLVRDLGLQFDLISYFQVEEGAFLKDPPQMVVMPAALAISPTEAQNLMKYVQNGGILVGDINPGICDDRCDFRQTTLLANLFGDGKTPGVKTIGKGKAILLGKEFAAYTKRQGRGNRQPTTAASKATNDIRNEVAKLMTDNGIKPVVPVMVNDAPLGHAEVVVMQRGDCRFLGILKENVRGIRRTTEDGVEYFEPLAAGQVQPAEQISAKLPQASHVYNVRTGKYLGKLDTITDSLEPAEAKLYALLPYQVKGMKLSCEDKFEKGKALHMTAALRVVGDAQEHVFNVHVYDPAGKDLYYLARNLIAPKGQVNFVIPVELNPAGPFRVVVTDVATGIGQTYDFGK